MTAPPARPWAVAHRHGPAAELHGLDLADPAERAVWILTPDRPALVLGSTQRDDLVDAEGAARRGVDVVRRRSGGGAVLLDPQGELTGIRTLWVDVVLPRDDPLWSDDVGRSMAWLGDAWVGALATLGIDGAVHRGALERTAGSTLVCFAGLGPGEVVVEDRKVVGISQRRTRAGARFQCVVHLGAGGGAATGAAIASVVDLLREPADPADRARLVAAVAQRTAAVAAVADEVIAALVRALPGT